MKLFRDAANALRELKELQLAKNQAEVHVMREQISEAKAEAAAAKLQEASAKRMYDRYWKAVNTVVKDHSVRYDITNAAKEAA